MVRSACILVIGVCLLAARASAHGGALHPGGPEQNNYIRAKVASCSNWVPATGTLKAGKVVPSSAKLAPITVQGPVTLWQYLYKNCSTNGEPPVAGAAFDVTITRAGKPLTGVPLDGVAMTGSCAANGGSTFYFDTEAKPLDSKGNKLWFTNGTAEANGYLTGNGANDGFIRTLAQGKKEAVKSMVLVDMKTQSILACCDLQPAGPASTNWTKAMPKGKVCDEEEGHGAHSPPTLLTNGTRAANGTRMANATKADDDHSDHDHEGHDHDHDGDGHDDHDHEGHDHAANATKPAAAATARSAAGAVSAGVLGAAAAAAAMVLLAL